MGGAVYILSTETYDNYIFESNLTVFENNKLYFNEAYQGAGLWVQSEFYTDLNQSFYLKTHLDFYNNLMHNNISQTDGACVCLNSHTNLNFHNNTVCNNYTINSILDMGDGIYIMENASNNKVAEI